MLDLVRKELLNLFALLDYTPLEVEEIVSDLMPKIETELTKEIHEGVREASKSNDLEDLRKEIGDETYMKILETAGSKILVGFYANAKASYSEEEKETYLTFLLTNKLRRELERANPLVGKSL